MRFRRKALTIIEAEQFTKEHTPKGVVDNGDGTFHVVTRQGSKVPVKHGEWIVQESNKINYYPIAEDVFNKIYEEVK